jgi:hypothetical protein
VARAALALGTAETGRVEPPRSRDEPPGAPFELDDAAVPFEPKDAGAVPFELGAPAAEPFELGGVTVPIELAGAAGEPPERGGAAAVPFDVSARDTEPARLVDAGALPKVDGRVEPAAGASAEPVGGMAGGTEIRPETVARPVLGLLTRAEACALGKLAAGVELTCADAEYAALGRAPIGSALTGAALAGAVPAGLALTGADAVARVVGAVLGEVGLLPSGAGAHSAPGAGGGGSAYP